MSLGSIRDGGDVGGIMRPVSEFFGDVGETIGTDSVGDRVEDGIDYYDDRVFEFKESIDEGTGFSGLSSTLRTVRLGAAVIAVFAGIYVLGQLFDVQVGGS